MNAQQFINKLAQDNEALFKASEMQVEAYFDSKPSQEKLVEHFVGRMVNERMNMVEISRQVADLGADADPVELELLTKQAQDEAKHFRMVKEVIEHIVFIGGYYQTLHRQTHFTCDVTGADVAKVA